MRNAGLLRPATPAAAAHVCTPGRPGGRSAGRNAPRRHRTRVLEVYEREGCNPV